MSIVERFACAQGDHDWVPVPMDEHGVELMEWGCITCGEPAPDELQTELDADYPEALE